MANFDNFALTSVELYRVQLASALASLQRGQHTLDMLNDVLAPSPPGKVNPNPEPPSTLEGLIAILADEAHRLSARLDTLYNRF